MLRTHARWSVSRNRLFTVINGPLLIEHVTVHIHFYLTTRSSESFVTQTTVIASTVKCWMIKQHCTNDLISGGYVQIPIDKSMMYGLDIRKHIP